MVRIKDIAQKANVSTATVSNVLNNSNKVSGRTKEKVLKTIEELNYRPNTIAKSLKLNKTSTIGVIAEDITVFNTPEIIDGINDFAEEHGFYIILNHLRLYKMYGRDYKSTNDQLKDVVSKAIERLSSRQVDGLIYIGTHPRDVTGIINNTQLPVVYTYCYTTNNENYIVNYNDELASFEATNFLIEKGHTRIGVISGQIDSEPSHRRLNGYQRALIQHSLPFIPSYIQVGDWEYQSGYKMAKELLSLKKAPTALLVMNDIMAAGVLHASREMGIKVPEDLSIIGFDNRECGLYFTPPLTTMALPLHEMGRKSMEILINTLNKKEVTKQYLLSCSMVERESVSFCQSLID